MVELWLCCQLFGANGGKQRRTEVHVGRHRMDRQARIVAGEGKDMNDREMLELAAKAAGLRVGFEPNRVERGRYDLYWSHVHHRLCWHGKTAGSEYPVPVFWNPLTDDGDALRLAVKLGMDVMHTNIHSPQVHAMAAVKVHVWEDRTDDPYAATRRAIVRAAAAIGEQK